MNAEPNPAHGARAAATAPAVVEKHEYSYGLLGRSVAEAMGSFFLVFVGVGVTFFSTGAGISAPLAFGFAVAAGMVAFGYVSGGQFNPAITLGSAAAGRTPWRTVPVYVVAQLVGAFLAAAILWVALDGHPQLTESREYFAVVSNGYGANSGLEFPLAAALLTEVIAAALLVAVFLGATARRAQAPAAALAVGLTYAILLTFLVPITGGSINPARSSAVAVFAQPWALEQLWLFWVAPVLGAVIAGLVYRSIDLTVADKISAVSADADDAGYDDEEEGSDDDAAGTATDAKTDAETGAATDAKTGAASDAEARGFFEEGDDKDGSGRSKA